MAVNTYPSSGSGGLQPYEQIFTTSGTWSVPASVKTAEVTLVGGGGGAVMGQNSGGGSGGGYIKRTIDVSAYSGSTIPVTIGSGGTSTQSATTATPGGTSSFGSILNAFGGTAGIGTGSTTTANGFIGAQYCQGPSGVSEVIGGSLNGIIAGKTLAPSGIVYTGSNLAAWAYTPTYGSTNGRANGISLLAGGASNSIRDTWTSTDGLSWTYTANAIPAAITGNIAATSTLFCAVAAGVTNSVYYSSNGTTWSTGTLPVSVNWNGGVVANGSTFLVFQQSTTNAATSTNGTTWTSQTLPSGTITSIWSAGSYFYAVAGTSVYYSSTGATGSWTVLGTTFPSGINYIGYNGTAYVLSTGTAPTTGIYYSTNGTTFTLATLPTTSRTGQTISTTTVNGVFNIGNYFFINVLQSTSVAVQFYSTNGSTWTEGNYYPLFFGYWNTTSGNPIIAARPYLSYTNAVSCGNNRYILPWQGGYSTAGTSLYGALLFSEGFTGGFPSGYLISAANNTQYVQSAGAGGTGYITVPNTGATAYPIINNGSPEGYCKGAPSYLNISGASSGLNVPSLNYGDGAYATNNTTGGVSGGQGLCIVRWWA